MNDSIITARQVADLKRILIEIQKVANAPPTIFSLTERPPTDRENLTYIERLARKAMRELP